MCSSRGLNCGNIERFEFNQKFAFVASYFPIQPVGSKQYTVWTRVTYTEDSQPSFLRLQLVDKFKLNHGFPYHNSRDFN